MAVQCVRARASASRNSAAPSASFELLSLDDDLRGRAAGTRDQLIAHLGGDVAVDLGMLAVRLGGHHRQTGIRLLADGHVQRHLAEERHPEARRLLLRAAMAENIRALAAARAEEIAHVLDNAE